MAGIYVHIPFCKQSCSYCDFHFSTSLKYKNEIIKAIVKEINVRKNLLSNTINTIYFGGGTPSILTKHELSIIVEELYKNYAIADNIEFTLECNPDDISKEKIASLQAVGVNRLSIGIQSFDNEELKFYKRAHNATEAENSIKLSQDAGFDNITVDLIYGSPILTEELWLKNLQKIEEYSIPHLSAYSLTVEPKTALSHQIKVGKTEELKDENIVAQYQSLVRQMKQTGLVQYEVSNFGKEGFFSQHNSNYWKGEAYLGFGPSAHSYLDNKRLWNVANNIKYFNALSNGEVFFEEESIDETMAFNEYILTRLRTVWGIDREYIKTNYNQAINEHFNREIKHYLNSSYLHHLNNKIVLTAEGVLLADKITSDLFYT